jgi:hypothetical protein
MNGGRAWAFRPRQVLAATAVAIVVLVSAPAVPAGIDWSTVLRPATLVFLHLGNPYDLGATFNPPWLFVLLTPLAVLPVSVGGVVLFWLDLATWVVVSKKLGTGSVLNALAVVTSPMVVNGLLARNVDFLVMWGLLLPPELAVFFLAIKPQVGGAALVYLAVREYRRGGLRRVARIFLIPCAISILAFLAYGLKPSDAREAINLPWNASPLMLLGWPSIAIGLCILVFAHTRQVQKDGARMSMAATPFFSPYVGSQSWVSILPALMKSKALYLMWVIAWAWIVYVLVR